MLIISHKSLIVKTNTILRDLENKSVGVFAWVFPPGRGVNTAKNRILDKYTLFQ